MLYNVIFYEKGEIILSQVREKLPEEGQGIKVKGRKGKVLRVEKSDDEKRYYITVETVSKKAEDSNKKR
ncbi:hypothetical protein [Litchfieldia alkalitelluris]|uniref:hypothetical protein n=1 Tax=Litchfieldia alkalitelluris TaxID=304268 RepID=UPI0011223C66|nr:hypothetical protein [Litchfieldia alkalitelluris]